MTEQTALPTRVTGSTRDRGSAAAIGLGSIAMVALMAMHPSIDAHGLQDTVREIAHGAAVNRSVHGMLIAVACLVAAGYAGFAETLPHRFLGRTGLLAWLAGTLAMAIAGLINGFAVTGLAERYDGAAPADAVGLSPVFSALWQLNQAFAGTGVVAMALAVVLWSASLVRTPGAARWVGAAGCLFGVVAGGAMLADRLHLDVHGFGLFVGFQAAWSVAAAALLAWGRR